MPKTHIAISILPEEYEAFVRFVPNDERFPDTYDDWVKRTSEENAKCKSRGDILNEVVIHPEEFAEYCRATRQEPSYVILEAVAVRKAHQQS